MSHTAEKRGETRTDRQVGRLLAEHLRRIARGTPAPPAVHMQIRERFPASREAALLRLFLRPLQDLAQHRGAPAFLLSSRDIVIICENIVPADIVAACTLPEPDPSLPVATIRPLIRWYDLSEADDRLALIALARVHADSLSMGGGQAPAGPPKRPLDARTLAEINNGLKSVRICDLIRSQTALIAVHGKFEPLFQEFFVSMAELQERFAPQIDLFSRPALFRYLTERLDTQVLKAFANGSIPSEYPISLNLNVRSICSADFQAMLDARDRSQPFLVEVQISDLLANPAAFQQAARRVRDGRGKLVIDGLTPLMLCFLDIGTLAADFVKIAWHDATEATQPPHRREGLAARIAAFGADRVILSRVETLESLQVAVELGVKRLQGHLIDRLTAASFEAAAVTP